MKKSRNIGEICCEKTEMPTQWGCYTPYKKKKKVLQKREKKIKNTKNIIILKENTENQRGNIIKENIKIKKEN